MDPPPHTSCGMTVPPSTGDTGGPRAAQGLNPGHVRPRRVRDLTDAARVGRRLPRSRLPARIAQLRRSPAGPVIRASRHSLHLPAMAVRTFGPFAASSRSPPRLRAPSQRRAGSRSAAPQRGTCLRMALMMLRVLVVEPRGPTSAHRCGQEERRHHPRRFIIGMRRRRLSIRIATNHGSMPRDDRTHGPSWNTA